MSCIVACLARDKIYMGSDSCVSTCSEQRTKTGSKIFKKGPYIIGTTGYPRPSQVIQNYWEPSSYKDIQESIKDILSKHGCITNSEEGVEIMNMQMLIGYRNIIFEITNDFTKIDYIDDYGAVGCGRPYALGSFFNSGTISKFSKNYNKIDHDRLAINRIKKALKCSEYFAIGVRRPFYIYTNENDRIKEVEIIS